MTTFIRRIPFPIKLSLIGLIPLAFLLYFAVQIHTEKVEKIELTNNLLGQIKRSILITNLINEFQLERRYAYLYSMNLQDNTKLTVQLQRTDDALKTLKADPSIREKFEQFVMIDQLPVTRQSVLQRSISGEATMEYYTNVIFRLINQSNASTGRLSYLSSVNEDLDAQRLLSLMASYLGVARIDYYTLLIDLSADHLT